MDTLSNTVKYAMLGYAGQALNGWSYLTSSDDQSLFTILSVGQAGGQHIVDTGLVVLIRSGRVIIERDVNDRPLVDVLIADGIPRDRIVLAYAGESADEAA
ncbi:MAG TPA: element excision factor XisI family protein [Chloroflexota bacterium]|nr:element excision factor XisI family protein [Chloroflexota bacterium]